jgi:uncharacterized protein (TIGR02679 family)
VVDAARLERILGDPGLARLVERLVRRLELDRPLNGTLTIEDASPGERSAVARLLGRRPGRGSSLSVPLDTLEQVLCRAGLAPDLRAALESVAGGVQGRGERTAAEALRRETALSAASDGLAAEYGPWLAEIARDGTLTRLLNRDEDELLRQATAVLALLPADGLPLPVLAERATGDTKALSRGPLAGLVLRALAGRSSVPVPATRTERRDLWEVFGVILDDLSSQVLVLGLSGSGGLLGDWLTQAALAWMPFRVTLHQLVAMPISAGPQEIYVCENPSVLRAAVVAPSPRAALICTEGVPSAACHRLLQAMPDRPIHWRGDFDWTGLRTTAMAREKYGAAPWRMSASDYQVALEQGDSEPLRGPAAPSPWDEPLASLMAEAGRAVMEERLIPSLLADLTAGSGP